MNKDELIRYMYYLLDKIDEAYYREVKISIERFVNDIDKYFVFKGN